MAYSTKIRYKTVNKSWPDRGEAVIIDEKTIIDLIEAKDNGCTLEDFIQWMKKVVKDASEDY